MSSEAVPVRLQQALQQLDQRAVFGIQPGLDVVRAMAARLDNPHHAFLTIHVAGTNGKGSTCAFIESVLRAAGFRTGLYTSPHLVSFRERIRIAGACVPPEELADALETAEAAAAAVAADGLRAATYFEAATAAAFECFRRRAVQIAVVETGLGGRWDATNIVAPLVAVITRIDYDHQQYLGNTLAAIAGEKAGILKCGRPAVAGPMPDEALGVLRREAERVQCLLVRADEVVHVTRKPLAFPAQKLKISTARRDCRPVEIQLAGAHQAENAAVAVAALERFEETTGLELPAGAMERGLAAARWPGRAQVIGRDPLTILDGAHNPGGAQVLAALLAEAAPARRCALVFSFLRDKDGAGLLRALAPHVGRAWAVELPGARAVPAEELVAAARRAGIPAESCPLPDALAAARAWARAEGAPALVAGSLYLAGAVLAGLPPAGQPCAG